MPDEVEAFGSMASVSYRATWPAVESDAGDQQRFLLVYGQLGTPGDPATWGLAVFEPGGGTAVEHVWEGRPRKARVADLSGWLRQYASPDAADALAGRFAATRPDLLERR
jgi:hypothetical protein